MAAKAPGVATGRGWRSSHVRLAADWCGFLEAHARKLYAVELHAGASAAHALAAKIQAGAIFDGQSVRELYRAQWAGLRTPERVLAGLTELTDLGWVRVEYALTGGRSSQVVRLHPDLWTSRHPTDTDRKAGTATMHEYIPQWSAPENTAKTPSDGTDTTDKRAFVSCVSAPSTRFAPVLPADAAALRAEIMATLDVEREDFCRERYDALWARLTALEGTEIRSCLASSPDAVLAAPRITMER